MSGSSHRSPTKNPSAPAGATTAARWSLRAASAAWPTKMASPAPDGACTSPPVGFHSMERASGIGCLRSLGAADPAIGPKYDMAASRALPEHADDDLRGPLDVAAGDRQGGHRAPPPPAPRDDPPPPPWRPPPPPPPPDPPPPPNRH